MQKLHFEHAWEKTLSQKDWLALEQLFQETVSQQKSCIVCHVFRQAINHKNQMLITVLIHNFSNDELTFENREVHCLLDEGQVSQKFTLQALSIPPKTSMPWTFIFDDSTQFLFANLLAIKICE